MLSLAFLPRRALGELLVIAEKMAGITGKCNSDLSKKVIVVMAGDHGIVVLSLLSRREPSLEDTTVSQRVDAARQPHHQTGLIG